MTDVRKLNIPYRSQWADDASTHQTDCGPACMAMLLNAYGKWATPDSLYKFINPPKPLNKFVTMAELMQIGRSNHLPFHYKKYAHQQAGWQALTELIDQGFAPIALIKYEPWQQFTGNRFKWGHFVVVTGYDAQHVYLHDPLFGLWVTPAEKGSHLKMTRSLFMSGWGGFPIRENPNFVAIVPSRSLHPTPPAPEPDPAPPAPPAPQPAPVPPAPTPPPAPEPIVDAGTMTAEDARRIRALAGYLDVAEPNLDDPEVVQFWMKYIGDWGKTSTAYTVKSGDTFGIIAFHFYNESARWKAIQRYNNISAEWVWVGQRLRIPMHDSAESHLNAELREVLGVAQFTPTSTDVFDPALDYDAFGADSSIGMGIVEEAEE